MPKKSASKDSRSSSIPPGIPRLDRDARAIEEFKLAIIFNPRLDYKLNLGRVDEFSRLLKKLQTSAERKTYLTDLLKLACDENDPEAIHVLLRSNECDFNSLTVSHLIKVLAKTFYFSRDDNQDRDAILILLALRKVFSKKCEDMTVDELARMICSEKSFDIHHLRDEYLANMLLSAIEAKGLAAMLVNHRQDFFIHACQFGFKNMLRTCFSLSIFPELERIPLILISGHSPLAYYAFHPNVDKPTILQRLLAEPVLVAELSPVLAFELLALCYYLDDGSLAELKRALKERLNKETLSDVITQILMGGLIAIVCQHDADIRSKLTPEQLKAMAIAGRSLVLSRWISNNNERRFFSLSLLDQCIVEIDRLQGISGLSQEKIFQEADHFFEGIIPLLFEMNNKNVMLFFAVFIRQNNVNGLRLLSAKFESLFNWGLEASFSSESLLNVSDFSGFTPLVVALKCHSPAVVRWLYDYVITHEVAIDADDLSSYSFDLLCCLVEDEKPNRLLIHKCLESFPGIYCDWAMFRKLFDLCVNAETVDKLLLQKIVEIASPFFQEPLFNFYKDRQQSLTLVQLCHVRSTFKELSEDLQDSTYYSAQLLTLDTAVMLESFRKTPLEGLADISRQHVCELNLYELCLQFGAGEVSAQAYWKACMFRRFFWVLASQGVDSVSAELMTPHTAENAAGATSQASSVFTAYSLLCYGEHYTLAELALVLCPNLNFSQKIKQYASPLSMLGAHENGIDLARKLIYYLVEHKQDIGECDLVCQHFSPIYLLTLIHPVTPNPSGMIHYIPDVLGVSKSLGNTVKMQLIAYVDILIQALIGQNKEHSESVDVIKKNEKDLDVLDVLERFQDSLKETMNVGTMLDLTYRTGDSTLVRSALRHECDDMIPGAKRDEILEILFLDPSKALQETLNLTDSDVLCSRNYPNKGYLQPVDPVTLFMTQLELALDHRFYVVARYYSDLLCCAFNLIEVSLRQVKSFLHLLHRFSCAVDDYDKKIVQQFCCRVLVSQRLLLSKIPIDDEFFGFMLNAIEADQSTDVKAKSAIRQILMSSVVRGRRYEPRYENHPVLSSFPWREGDPADGIKLLLDNLGSLHLCSDTQLVELLVFTRAISVTAVVKSLQDALMAVIKERKINYISLVRHGLPSHPDMLITLAIDQAEFKAAIEGHDVKFLFNLAISRLNRPLFSALCNYMDGCAFSFDLLQRLYFFDDPAPLKPLEKICQSMRSNPDLIPSAIEILKSLLERSSVVEAGVEILNALKDLVSLIPEQDFISLMKVLELSAKNLETLFNFAYNLQENTFFISILNFYAVRFPDCDGILTEDDSVHMRLLSHAGLMADNTLLKKLLNKLDAKKAPEVIVFLNGCDESTLLAMQEVHSKKFKHQKLLSKAIDLKRRGEGSLTENLEQRLADNARAVREGLNQIQDSFKSLAVAPTTEAAFIEMLAKMDGMLVSLAALKKKTMGPERLLTSEPHQAERVIEKLEALVSRKKADMLKFQRRFMAAEQERQDALAAQARQKEAEAKQRQAAAAAQDRKKQEAAAERERLAAAARLAEQARREEDARKRNRRQEVEDKFVKPLGVLEGVVKKLKLNGETTIAVLETLKGHIDGHRKRCRELLQAVETEDEKFVNQTLEACVGRATCILENLDKLDARVSERIKEFEREEEKRRQLELQQQREIEERAQEEQRQAEEARKQQEAKALAEQQRIERERIIEEEKKAVEEKNAAEERQREKQAQEQQLAAARRHLAGLLSSASNDLLKLNHLDFVKEHRKKLQTKFAKEAQSRPEFFKAPPVVVIAKARLDQDECGLKVECIDRQELIVVDNDQILYVLDDRIQPGECDLYFDSEGKWTILQDSKEFSGCKVQPLFASDVKLIFRDKEREVEFSTIFMGGIANAFVRSQPS